MFLSGDSVSPLPCKSSDIDANVELKSADTMNIFQTTSYIKKKKK